MSGKKYAKHNYVFLYRGLLIARDALLEFIVNSLKEFYGPDWWKLGVETAFRSEDMTKLQQQFEKRFAKADGPTRPGTELYEMLDLNYFGNIIEYNWKKVFSSKLHNDRTLLAYMKEVVAYRNPVAHAETGDLRDDDTFRGLDTSERLLRLINKDAAEEIAQIKNELRRAWIYGEIGLGTFTPDKVGINLEKGFADLQLAMQQQMAGPQDLMLLADLKRAVSNDFTLMQELNKSGEFSSDDGSVIESLQMLSQKYLRVDFATACLVSLPIHKYTPEDLAKKRLHLDQLIEKFNNEIKRMEAYLEIQRSIGLEQKQWLLSRIEFKQKIMKGLENDLERIRDDLTAPVFFSVTRSTEATVQEEQAFLVQVEIKNLGRKKAKVVYHEGLPPGVTLLTGETEHVAEIEADSRYVFSYTCACNSSGTYAFYTRQLDYDEKINAWDVLNDTVVVALPSKGPHLEGSRYYHFRPDGIELVITLENLGEKRARRVQIDNEVSTKDNVFYTTTCDSDVPAKEKRSASCLVPVREVAEIVLPEKTIITYFDNNDKEYTLELTSPFVPLEYVFPAFVEILGRKREVETVRKILRLVSGLATEGQMYVERRTILLEGVAGIGKTRFVQEIQRMAAESFNIQVRVEDVSTRSPIKRMLRSTLGLDPTFASAEMAWDRLETYKLDEDHSTRYRGVMARFLSSDYETLADAEMQDLITSLLLLVRQLCRKDSYLLVFENAHDFSEGIELNLLQKLVQFATQGSGIRLAVCITYRPNNNLSEHFLGRDFKMSECEKIVLTALSRSETASLVNELIPYPAFCEELQDFVFEWSQGNPFYVRELLRHLILVEQGLIRRIGNKWYPSEIFKKESFTSKEDQISTILLQRVKEDSGEYFPVVQVLAVVGLDLPYRLLKPLFESNKFYALDERQLLETLDRLVHKGILRQSNTDSLAELEYQFEHQLIRDAIYLALRETIQHTIIRDQVVDTVIKNKYEEKEIYADREEHYRQVARHLLYSGTSRKFTYRDYLLKAARIEEVTHNFVRSLEYYQCFLDCSSDKDNYIERAEAYIDSAGMLKLQGNWTAAIDRLKTAQEIMALVTNREERERIKSLNTRIMAELGFLYMKTGDFHLADEYLSNARLRYEGPLRAFRLYFLPQEKDFIKGLFEIYLALAEIWYRKLDMGSTAGLSLRAPLSSLHWNYSDAYFARAEIIAAKYREFFKDNQLLVDVLIREGEIRSSSQRDLALKKLLNALESIKKQSSANHTAPYSMERIYLFLAELYRERNELEAASKYYKEARQVQEKLGDIYGLAISNGGIADLYMQQEQFADAEYYLLEAYEKQRMVHDAERLWRTCFSLTKVYVKAGSLEKARQYWLEARPLLLTRLTELSRKKVHDIFETLLTLAKRYFDAGNLVYALPLCLDLQIIGATENRRAEVDEMLGNIYYKMKEPTKAIRALYEGLVSTDDPLKQADIHRLIGDICASADDESFKYQVEESYAEAMKLFVKNKLEKEALDVYERLLQYLSSQSDSKHLAPLLHNLIELMFHSKMGLGIKFLEKAEPLYTQYELFREAGDTFIHLAYKAVQSKDLERETHRVYGSDESLYDRELVLLEKAEEYYSKCKTLDEKISGYYNLISVYFRMNMWDQIARCYGQILNACLHSNEERDLIERLHELDRIYEQVGTEELVELVKGHQTLLSTLREINMLPDKFGLNDMTGMCSEVEKIEVLVAAQPDLFTGNFRYQLLLNYAKLLYHAADKFDDENARSELRLKSLEKFDVIIDECTNIDIKAVSYNDSALILRALDRPEEAEIRLIQSIEIARNAGDEFAEACSRANLASSLFGKGNFGEAIAQYELSMGYLVARNRFWDQRWMNKDIAPLAAEEIPHLRFDKVWCARVATEYSQAIFFSDPEKGRELASLAENIYFQLGEPDHAQTVRRKRDWIEQLLQRSMRLEGDQTDSLFLPHSPTLVSVLGENNVVTCASCGYAHNAGWKGCPRCGEVTCPHCNQLTDPDNEICETCYRWIR